MARTSEQIQRDIDANALQATRLRAELASAHLALLPRPGQIFRYRYRSSRPGYYSEHFYLAVGREMARTLHGGEVPAGTVYGVALHNGQAFGFSHGEFELELVAGRL